MIPTCLKLSNIKYVSRVKWSNSGKGVAPSPTLPCCSYWKEEPSGHPWLQLRTLLTYIYIYIYIYICRGGQNNGNTWKFQASLLLYGFLITALWWNLNFSISLLTVFEETAVNLQAVFFWSFIIIHVRVQWSL